MTEYYANNVEITPWLFSLLVREDATVIDDFMDKYTSFCCLGKELLLAYADLCGPKRAVELVAIQDNFRSWRRDW